MRRKLILQLFICVLGTALLFTLGMKFQSPVTYSADTTSKLTLHQIQTWPANTLNFPSANKVEESRSLIDFAVIKQDTKQQNRLEQGHVTEKDQLNLIKSEGPATTYEVTAYYLNVRANAYVRSKILNVVKKGTLLEVLKTTENGWLKIKDGGYVFGLYAQPVSLNEKQTDLSNQTAVIDQTTSAEIEISGGGEESGNPDKPTSAVGTESGLSKEDIALIFAGTALEGHGLEDTILEVEKKYGINAFFTIAVMKLESGNGSSRIAKSKNNLFGLNATSGDKGNKAYSFETKGDSIIKFGQLLSQSYVGKGFTTVEKIGTKYCPANSKWSGLVKNIMKMDYGKLNVI
jgi:uncharacterized protein YgiM (DUF1202 family)